MARLSFRCDDDLVLAVDSARGAIARERFLRDLVSNAVGQAPPEPRESVSAPEDEAEDDVKETVFVAAKPDHDVCPNHPDAGRVKSRGVWWCAYPACSVRFLDA